MLARTCNSTAAIIDIILFKCDTRHRQVRRYDVKRQFLSCFGLQQPGLAWRLAGHIRPARVFVNLSQVITSSCICAEGFEKKILVLTSGSL